MDVELMKSSAQDQVEMMTMMMQLDRLPEVYRQPYSNTSSELPELEFSGVSATSIETTTTPIFHNHNPPVTSTTPFLSTSPVQEPMTTPSPRFRITPSALLQKRNSMEAMREMIFRVAVMQPIQIDPESVKAPKRRNVKISKDPQSVAARHRRERISERMRILQRLVPGGTKMDTASMLDEAIHYVKFLKKQVQSLEQAGVNNSNSYSYNNNNNRPMGTVSVGFPTTAMLPNVNYLKACHPSQMLR